MLLRPAPSPAVGGGGGRFWGRPGAGTAPGGEMPDRGGESRGVPALPGLGRSCRGVGGCSGGGRDNAQDPTWILLFYFILIFVSIIVCLGFA